MGRTRSVAGNTSEVPVIAEALFSYQIGGSERVGVDLAIEFRRRGYRVVCFAVHDTDGPMRAELEQSGIRCLDLNYDKFKGVGVLRRAKYLWSCWRILRRERISALHVHHVGTLVLCGIPAQLARVRKVLLTEHGLDQLKDNRGYRRSAAYYCRLANDITVVEPAQADYFQAELRVPAGKLHYVRNGTRPRPTKTAEDVRAARARLQISADLFVFLYVGRLSPEKDLGTLLDAFAQLPAELSDRSRLYLAGDGAEREDLQRKSAAMGLTARVVFLGARSDVPEVLVAADAFVMSSKTEGLPMVLLEAMAAGIPCVATAVGGIPQLFESERGVLVPPQDPGSLARAMVALAESAGLRDSLVANALDNLRTKHAFHAIADQYLRLLGLPLTVSVAEMQEPVAPSSDQR
jgi:glycosyltransferase involved in cell wall biosynthesis